MPAQKSSTLQIRVDRSDRDLLSRAAAAKALTLSAYVRSTAVQRARADLDEAPAAAPGTEAPAPAREEMLAQVRPIAPRGIHPRGRRPTKKP